MAFQPRKASPVSDVAASDYQTAQTVFAISADHGPLLEYHSPMLLTPMEAASSGHKHLRRTHGDIVYLLRCEQRQIVALEEARSGPDAGGKEWNHWASHAIQHALHLFSDSNARLRVAPVTRQVLPLLQRHLPGLSASHGLELLSHLRQLGMALLFEEAAMKAGKPQRVSAAVYTGTIRAMLSQALADNGSDEAIYISCLVRMGLPCASGPVLPAEPTQH